MEPSRGKSWSATPDNLRIAYHVARAAAVRDGGLGSRVLMAAWWAEARQAGLDGYLVIVADVRMNVRWAAFTGFVASRDHGWKMPADLDHINKEVALHGRALPAKVARVLYPFISERYRKA